MNNIKSIDKDIINETDSDLVNILLLNIYLLYIYIFPFLDHHLQPIAQKVNSFLKDTNHLPFFTKN